MIDDCKLQIKKNAPQIMWGVYQSDVKLFSHNTFTYLRLSRLLTSILLLPSAVVNKVWSRPIPTLLPAWNLVPR